MGRRSRGRLHSASRPGYSGRRQSKQANWGEKSGERGPHARGRRTDGRSARERVIRVETATGPRDASAVSAWPEDPRTAAAVTRGKQGDRDAVRFLYERYADGVRQLAYRMLGDRDAADDLTQTVFLRLLTKLDHYEARERPFEVWLLRVTRNAALDELRRRRVMRAEPVGQLASPPDDGLGAGTPLFTALAGLPMSQREVVVLRLVVGLSATETASRLGRTDASVNNLYLRARATLRAVLTGLGAAPATARSVHAGSPVGTGD